MRVLLVYTNRSRLLEPPPPVGLGYVASAAKRAGHRVFFLDLLPAANPGVELRHAIERFQPQVIGVSVRNVDTIIPQRLQWQLGEAAGWIRQIRGLTSVPVVVGGPAITALGAVALQRLEADFAIVGEGEQPFVALLEALRAGGDYRQIPGLCYRNHSELHSNPPSRNCGFGVSGLGEWIDWRCYERAGAAFPIHTKRGCGLSCLYCNYPAMDGRQLRMRSAADVVDEIAEVDARLHPSTFEFTDSAFNLPESHAAEICEEILRRSLRVRLSSVGINPLGVTPKLVRLLKRAGFVSLHVSADSASDRMLASLDKGFTLREVRDTARLLAASGIRCLWFFLFGAPGENRRTVEETLAFIEKHLNTPRFLNVLLTGLRIMPGSPLAAQLVASGRLDPRRDLSCPLFYFSPEVSEDWVLRRINRSIRRCPALVHGGEESGSRIERMFHAMLRAAGKAPPFIRYLPVFLRLPLVARLRAAGARTCPSSTAAYL